MNNSRNATLDLSRFIAALIVFAGHLIFFVPKTYIWSPETISVLSLFRTGEIAVLYFFALSGFVLTIGTSNQLYSSWVKKRLIRLYPVYISAWFLGFAIVVLHNYALLNVKVIFLGLIGFQSLDPEGYAVINAPLWSLSVEIVFAFFLYYILRLRTRPIILLSLLFPAVLLWQAIPSSLVCRALPYFIIGVLLNSERVRNVRFNNYLVAASISAVAIYYVFDGASRLLAIPNNFWGELMKIVLISLAVFSLSQVEVHGRAEQIFIALGKRSFCLYAFHYPVLLVVNYFVQPKSALEFSVYAIISILVSIATAEFTFRCIDLPSTRISRGKN